MAKPFSQMTETEKRINRARMASGKAADWTEQMGLDRAGVRFALDAAQDRAFRNIRDYERARAAVSARMPQLALDSATDAAGVYYIALNAAGVNLNGVHRSAYRDLYDLTIGGGAKRHQIAMDQAAHQTLAELSPNFARIRKG